MRDSRGATLLETVLAILIMAGVGLAVTAMLQRATEASLRARERVTCQRMAQSGMARLKNIAYFSLFAVDSSSAGWATPPLHAAYPYRGTLDGIRSTLAASKFDRFRVGVVFMRRDTTDAAGTGSVSDLIPFKDDGTGADAYDPAVRFFDQDADGDFYETYDSGGRTVSEQPDTHIKKVTFDVFRGGRKVCGLTELISLEQFTGLNRPSSESALILEVSTPSNNSYAYQALTPVQTAALALAAGKPYPAGVSRYRADAGWPMTVSGLTAPLATVALSVGGSGILGSAPSDSAGAFSAAPPALTAALVEGVNTVRGRAAKSTYSSPWAERTVILDVAPPQVSTAGPVGAVATYQPAASAVLTDPVVAPGAVPSGLCPDVTELTANGASVPFSYDATTGAVVWIDPATQSPPVLSSGTYVMSVAAGDFAGYKTSATWTFTVSVPATDASAPSVSNKSPIGGSATSGLPLVSARVFDNQSGIDPASVAMTLDGAPVSAAYDPGTGTVSYLPSAPFAPGSYHTATLTARHWATNPSNKVQTTDTWGFTVP